MHKVKIDEDTHEIDLEDLTLGEQWWLERDFGVNVTRPEQIGVAGWLVGVIAIVLKRANPSLSEAEARAEVEARPQSKIEVTEVKPERPTRAGAKRAGASAKTPPEPGPQSSPASTA